MKRPAKQVQYSLGVLTGKKRGAGTDANVWATLFGEKGDTGQRPLRRSAEHRDKFQRGNLDTFVLDAVDLGRLTKLRIGHDDSGPGSGSSASKALLQSQHHRFEGWYLEKVTVAVVGEKRQPPVDFPCDRWLAKDEEDGAVVRDLFPAGISLQIFCVF